MIYDRSYQIENTIRDLKRQLEQLTEEHAKALSGAVYLGMTVEQARQYDERRRRITELRKQLAALENSNMIDT